MNSVRVILTGVFDKEFAIPEDCTAAELKELIARAENVRPPLELININDGITLADEDIVVATQPLRVSSVAGPANEQNVFTAINARLSKFSVKMIQVTLSSGRIIRLPVYPGSTVGDIKQRLEAYEGVGPSHMTIFTRFGSSLVDKEEVHDGQVFYVSRSPFHCALLGDDNPRAGWQSTSSSTSTGFNVKYSLPGSSVSTPFRNMTPLSTTPPHSDESSSTSNSSNNLRQLPELRPQSAPPAHVQPAQEDVSLYSIDVEVPTFGGSSSQMLEIPCWDFMCLQSSSEGAPGMFAFSPSVLRHLENIGATSISGPSQQDADRNDPRNTANGEAGTASPQQQQQPNGNTTRFSFNVNVGDMRVNVRFTGDDARVARAHVGRMLAHVGRMLAHLDAGTVFRFIFKAFCIMELCFFILRGRLNIFIKSAIIGLALLLYMFPSLIRPVNNIVPEYALPHNLPMPPRLYLDFTDDPAEIENPTMTADEGNQLILDTINREFRQRRSFIMNSVNMLSLLVLTFVPSYYNKWKEQDDARVGAYLDAIKEARAAHRERQQTSN